MFIYGGMMDLGDIEITLDDCWYDSLSIAVSFFYTILVEQ